jgi:transposase
MRFWHRRRGYRRVWHTLLNLLVQGKRLHRSLISLDGTLIPSQEFTEQTGYSGKHRAVETKLSLLVDRAGTPLAVSVAPGNYHNGPPRVLTLANIFKPLPILRDILPDAAKMGEPTLLADKGYDSRRIRQFVCRRCRAPAEALCRRTDAGLAQRLPAAAVPGGPHGRLLIPSRVRAPTR